MKFYQKDNSIIVHDPDKKQEYKMIILEGGDELSVLESFFLMDHPNGIVPMLYVSPATLEEYSEIEDHEVLSRLFIFRKWDLVKELFPMFSSFVDYISKPIDFNLEKFGK